jgi:hypothetical protein
VLIYQFFWNGLIPINNIIQESPSVIKDKNLDCEVIWSANVNDLDRGIKEFMEFKHWLEITQKPVVFLSSPECIANNPTDGQIKNQIFAKCLMCKDDYNEYLEVYKIKRQSLMIRDILAFTFAFGLIYLYSNGYLYFFFFGY